MLVMKLMRRELTLSVVMMMTILLLVKTGQRMLASLNECKECEAEVDKTEILKMWTG